MDLVLNTGGDLCRISLSYKISGANIIMEPLSCIVQDSMNILHDLISNILRRYINIL